MNKHNIEQIIRGLFKENYTADQSAYPLNEDGDAFENEASEHAADVAKSFYANRTEDEIERDENLGITEIDYVEWCMSQLAHLYEVEQSNRLIRKS